MDLLTASPAAATIIIINSSSSSSTGLLAHSSDPAADLHKDSLTERDLLRTILTALPTLIIVIGTIAGNVLVCVAIGWSRQLRKNITNAFCASLAISDLLLGLFVLPISFGRLMTDNWTLGTVLCNVYISMDVFLSTASILNLFIVSIDRYYAITRPLLYRTIITKRTATVMLTIVWLMSAVIGFLPIYLGWNTEDGRVQNVDNPLICDFPVENLFYSFTIGVGTFYIPLLILYLMYTKILTISYGHVKAIRAQTTLHNQFDGEKQNSNKNILLQHRATLTLFIIVGAFSICWLPYFTCFTISPLTAMSDRPLMANIFLWMGYFNSFINPFVYGMTNREYRSAFHQLLCSWRKHPEHFPVLQHREPDYLCKSSSNNSNNNLKATSRSTGLLLEKSAASSATNLNVNGI
ncbi:Histamine H2 receptor [Hypsibius exemplaris]|uniref:Histamine H2 receptor n=1 Tax=Hypsibius exemplaris TaxID=2072580 RepID=A0A1W0WQG4_HYPEX|nr:Histamine H2 receptor [Hypsibius exemplaris]